MKKTMKVELSENEKEHGIFIFLLVYFVDIGGKTVQAHQDRVFNS